MHVEIWSDIACPWCYIGKRRFEQAVAQFAHRDALRVTWRSFELDPGAPPVQSRPQAELLAEKYRMSVAQAEAMNARMAGEAAKEGLVFRLDRVRVGNTFDAHRLIHHAAAAGRREEMVERLFAAYLSEGEALGDRDTLVRLADAVGLDAGEARAMLESGQWAAEVRADEERARMFGITGVPFFAVDERYGVSGAQQPAAILAALQQAWDEGDHAVMPVAAAGPSCDGDVCVA